MFVFWNRQSKHVSHVPLCVCLIHTHTPRAALTRLGLGFSQEPNVIALLPLDCASRRPLRAAVTSFFPFPSMCVCVCGNRPPLSRRRLCTYWIIFSFISQKKRKEKKKDPAPFCVYVLSTSYYHGPLLYDCVALHGALLVSRGFTAHVHNAAAAARSLVSSITRSFWVWKNKGIDMFFGLIVNVNSRIGRDFGKKESKSWFLTYIIEDNHNHNHRARLCAPSGRGWKGGKSNGFDTQSKEINMNKKPNHRPHRFIIRDRFFFKFPAFISWEWRCCFTSIQAKGSRWIQYVIFFPYKYRVIQ
jgi:hypothetical protein